MHQRYSRRVKHFEASETLGGGFAAGSRPLCGAFADDRDVFARGKEKLRTSIVYSGPPVGSCGQRCANSRKLRRVKGNGTSNARGQQAAESHTAAERKMK